MPLFAVEYSYSDTTVPARDEYRPAHRSWLADRVADDTVRAVGPYVDGSGALVLVEAADEAAAREVLAQDPFAVHGLIDDVRIKAWQPVMGVFTN